MPISALHFVSSHNPDSPLPGPLSDVRPPQTEMVIVGTVSFMDTNSHGLW